MKELFDIALSPSPRLIWMEKHAIRTNRAYVDGDEWPVECPETGEEVLPWIAWAKDADPTPENSAQGMTEFDALDALAVKLKIPTW